MFFTPEFFAECQDLFAQALAAESDPAKQDYIKKLHLSLWYVQLRISAAEHYASCEEAQADAERFRAECNRLGVTRLSEGREINNGIDRMIALRIPPQFGLPEQPVEG